MVEVREGGRALVLMVEEVEVDGDAVAQAIEGADHALGIVGAIRDAKAVLGEFPGQGDLRAVDGEDPAALPGRTVGAGGKDRGVQAPERGFVELLARRAGGRRCGRLVLRQRDAGSRALFPECAQRRPVALPARCGDEAEDEQHERNAGSVAPARTFTQVLSQTATRHPGLRDRLTQPIQHFGIKLTSSNLHARLVRRSIPRVNSGLMKGCKLTVRAGAVGLESRLT